MECHVDHVHMFISCPPKMSPADAVKIIKGCTSAALRKQFPKLSHMSSLWTRSYFVSTAGDVSAATIEKYIATQKTRPSSKKHK
jgi:putative transposase